MIFELTKELSGAFGPTGRESGVRELIENKIRGHVDEIYTDKMGNLVARKKGNGKKIMVSSHMDSIGFAVTFIDENGFIRFGSAGYLYTTDIINIPVKFKNGTRGVVAHDNGKQVKDLVYSDFYIDIGAKNREEAEKFVKVGDFAVFANECFEQGDAIVGPYMDDRIACAISIMAILDYKKTDNDVYYVFSTQEEVGLRGAMVATYNIDPDYGIAVDVSGSGDTPCAKDCLAVKLGGGPTVKIMDGHVICAEEVVDLMYKTAKDMKINVQDEILRSGGTDAGAMQRSRSGALVGAISIPTRYIHSPCEMVNINDVKNATKLLIETVTRF